MTEKILSTVIVLRNDSSTDWADSSVVLAKGEMGISYLANGKVIAKMGDGVNTWASLPQVEGVYESNLILTKAFGKYIPENGMVEVPCEGMTSAELILDAFSEEENPEVSQPSASISASGKTGETGSTYTYPTGTLTIDSVGSYEFGSKDASNVRDLSTATGITFAEGDVTIKCGTASKSNTADLVAGGTVSVQATGSSNVFTDAAVSYTFTGTAQYTESDKVPVSNLGNKVESLRIGAGDTESKGSITIANKTVNFTGWRKMFMGAIAKDAELTSANIRGITQVSKQESKSAQTFTAPVGTEKLLIAVRSDYSAVKPKVEYFTMSWEEFSGFEDAGTAQVADYRGTNEDGTLNGAVTYKLWSYTPAGALEAATQFRVTLK